MINIKQIAIKLNEILNGIDGFEHYQFNVETTGFHINSLSDKKTGKNFIPVFISTMGGQHNPVPNLKQTDFTIPITLYYPVRFKDDFFTLYDELCDIFVGKFITFGTQKARCNISLPQFGEIQDLDFKEFKEWVGSVYRREIEVMEPYLSMNVTLFLSTSGEDFIYGDNIKIKEIKINKIEGSSETQLLNDESPIVIERADIGTTENASQQAFDETYIKGYPANLGFTKELPLIVKNNEDYKKLIYEIEVNKNMQNLILTLKEEMPFDYDDNVSFDVTTDYYISNYSRRTSYGSLFGITLTLTPRR